VTLVVDRLAQRGLALPAPPAALAAYAPAVLRDGWIYTAGQLPLRDGVLVATGRLGAEIDVETGAAAAEVAALNALAAIAGVAPDIDQIQLVKLVGYVASTGDFIDQPAVINGASLLLADVLGEAGVHARSAVGVASLPLNAPVEIEVVAQLRDESAIGG
jgi:enamine deaminase RidA (YjgF/YER057c/UK114 family)